MLTQLTIHNFAIIEQLELEIPAGMTVITGETGAGKSIMLDALGLTLGDRADADSVRHGADRAEIFAHFDISQLPAARAWLAARELPTNECILRRTINRNGRSRGYINGHPCTLPELKELGEMLIDIHSQHAHQSLLKTDTHRRLLDEFGGHIRLARQVQQAYQQWRHTQQQLQQHLHASAEQQARLQLLSYQVQELEQLALGADELPQLEEEQRRLAHAEQLIRDSSQALSLCDNEEGGALQQLHQALSLLQTTCAEDARLQNALELLNEAHIQLTEASHELSRYLDHCEIDPERLQAVDSRLSAIYDTARKHHVLPEELPAHHARLQAELAELQGGDASVEALSEQLEQQAQHYRKLANQLSQRRQRAAQQLKKRIDERLKQLGMPAGLFEVALTHGESSFTPHGMESVEFLMSANPGQPPKPLARVASGGELSRISLAIQVAVAQTSNIATLVFDEVDVGIGGATAEIVGRLLRQLGERGQVLCVTHQPQVAAQGHHHLHISKRISRNTTRTQMQTLDTQARVTEIARMLGGLHLSEQSLAHAQEMLSTSQH